MENPDKIYKQFKNAAHTSESKDFDAMEKVWARVDAKLNTHIQKSNTKYWKKWLLGTLIVSLMLTIYFWNNYNQKVIKPQTQIVIIDSTQNTIVNPIAVTSRAENITIKKDSNIVKSIVLNSKSVPSKDSVVSRNVVEKLVIYENKEKVKSVSNQERSKTNDKFQGQIHEAIGVSHSQVEQVIRASKSTNLQESKQLPLVIVDGKIASKKEAKNAINNTNSDVETLYLVEPLYIINGVEYNEESLFGKNPTSPYSPLDQQDIIKITIYTGQEAIVKYGEKGKKGVVIITTKNGEAKTINKK